MGSGKTQDVDIGGESMTTTKTIKLPEIPREVSEAIEELRGFGYSNRTIVKHVHDAVFETTPAGIIKGYAVQDDRVYNEFLVAILHGYTVEKTPEEKVREFYEYFAVDASCSPEDAACAHAIASTLDLLDIKIPGVNVPDAEEAD